MDPSSGGRDQTSMRLLRSLQGRRKGRRLEKQFHKALLVFDGQANHLGFVDGPMCDLLGSGHHEIADAAALQFRGALDHQERIGCNASFDTSCAGCSLGHDGNTPKPHCTGFCLTRLTGCAIGGGSWYDHRPRLEYTAGPEASHLRRACTSLPPESGPSCSLSRSAVASPRREICSIASPNRPC